MRGQEGGDLVLLIHPAAPAPCGAVLGGRIVERAPSGSLHPPPTGPLRAPLLANPGGLFKLCGWGVPRARLPPTPVGVCPTSSFGGHFVPLNDRHSHETCGLCSDWLLGPNRHRFPRPVVALLLLPLGGPFWSAAPPVTLWGGVGLASARRSPTPPCGRLRLTPDGDARRVTPPCGRGSARSLIWKSAEGFPLHSLPHADSVWFSAPSLRFASAPDQYGPAILGSQGWS